MENKKFICPLCGKIWYTEKDLAICVTKDAAEAEKAKSEACRIEACRKSDYESLMKKKANIEVKYEELRKLINRYNREAQAYAAKYKQSLTRWDIACTFSTAVGKYPWIYSAETERCKDYDTSSARDWQDELRDIIRKELNF